MLARCRNRNHPQWGDYGGRGIAICGEWLHDFATFLRDMGEKPSGLTLERRDNDLGYSKANCYWADRFAQNQNRRRKGPQKLNAAQVLQIRADLRPYPLIAAQFDISVSHVCRIKKRRQWAHV
jgi:hypothetical protein